MRTLKLTTVAVLVATLASVAKAASAELPTAGVLVNARIHTLADGRPVAEALAWDATGRIVAVGPPEEVLAEAPGAPVHDANGATVVPGLIDAHAHLMGLGLALMRADLVGAHRKAEVVERLRAFAAQLPPDAWLLGRGWDQNDWPGKSFPTAADLDVAFPTRPVWLERIDGHAGWANSAALRRVARDLGGDWQPEGGRILRDDGRPTSVFIDSAAHLVDDVLQPPDESLRTEALRRALAATAGVGLTSVHDMGTSIADLDLYRRFADAGRRLCGRRRGSPRSALQDGTVPACVRPREHGGREILCGRCARLARRGTEGALQRRPRQSWHPGDAPRAAPRQHAQGASLRRAGGDARDRRSRHSPRARRLRGRAGRRRTQRPPLAGRARADCLGGRHPDIPAAACNRIDATEHATSDMPWTEARVGRERMAGAYAWRRLLRAGVHLALGSDFPVESVDPRLGLYAGVSRQNLAGEPPGGWLPDQKLTPAEALRGFTADAAWAGLMEHEVGRLAPGLRADFVLLDADPLAVPADRLQKIRVLSTWVDGTRVHPAP